MYQHRVEPSAIKQYDYIVIVAGSRGFNDYPAFVVGLEQSLHDADLTNAVVDDKVVFVSGMAPAGADAMIIRYCEDNTIPWIGMPADWDNIEVPKAAVAINKFGKPYNRRAGMMRNQAMTDLAAQAKCRGHCIAFYDAISPGTTDMIKRARQAKLRLNVVMVKVAVPIVRNQD